MLCALVGNSSEQSVHPGWLGAHSCRDAEMHSHRSGGAGSATVARAATPVLRHSPRSSTWYAVVSATSPPHAAAANSKVAAFIWSPARRNLRQARTISHNTPDKTRLWIMRLYVEIYISRMRGASLPTYSTRPRHRSRPKPWSGSRSSLRSSARSRARRRTRDDGSGRNAPYPNLRRCEAGWRPWNRDCHLTAPWPEHVAIR